MRAIQYSQFGGYDQLRPTEVPDPTPRDGEALIAQTFPLERAAEAQRHLIEDRPYGRVVLSLD
jgi:NADPH:quinone reductase-like Zn-dependent oxidoreductase